MPPPLALVLWTINSLRELCGFWSCSIKKLDIYFTLNLLGFTIENQLSLWRVVCLEGIIAGSEKGHLSL